jgi:RHS repeat-associated protein
MGSLVDGMRDASGQIYMRNRYYDPATGQFTQTDPIGLAGGLNVYGFANGDPVSYADPYGLSADSVWVGIRPLANRVLGLAFSHSAVRVDNDMYELQANGRTSVVQQTTVKGNSDLAGYVWFPVTTPAGQTDSEFSETVRQNALSIGGEINRTRPDYEALGANCHVYTNRVITSSGGQIPGDAEIQGDRSSPGLCSGGRGCTPATRRPMFDYGAPPPVTP